MRICRPPHRLLVIVLGQVSLAAIIHREAKIVILAVVDQRCTLDGVARDSGARGKMVNPPLERSELCEPAYRGSPLQSQMISRRWLELSTANSSRRATRQASAASTGTGALPSNASRMPE